jgi:hypothetical protein
MSNILVAAVSLLIAFLHLSSQLFVLLPWMECSVNNALRLLIFNLLTAMVYQSYYLACATDPGRVPSDYSKVQQDLKVIYYLIMYHHPLTDDSGFSRKQAGKPLL